MKKYLENRFSFIFLLIKRKIKYISYKMDPRVELDYIKAKMRVSDAILINRIFTNNCENSKKI